MKSYNYRSIAFEDEQIRFLNWCKYEFEITQQRIIRKLLNHHMKRDIEELREIIKEEDNKE